MTTDLKSYPAYKPSGVEWLGDVPEHWEVKKIKNLARSDHKSFVDGDWIESPYITSEGIRLIQTGNIGIGEYREKGFRYISEETYKEFACTEFQPGDVLVCRLGEPVARACLAPLLGKRMITSVDVCILKPRDDVNAQFVVHCMSSRQYLDWVGSLVRGSTRDRISRSMLGAFPMPLPPLPEQTAIVRYLDYVDRRILRYVSAKRKLIAVLEEEKQAIVNQAVTRGLDPNVRLKPSGVEWLGEVPEHWEVVQLGRIGKFSKGGGGTKEDEVDVGLPCIRYGDIYMHHKYHIERSRSYISLERSSNYTPMQYGDILFAGSGETIDEIGKSAVNLFDAKAYCGGDVILFRPGIEVNSRFTGYATDCVQSAYQKSCMGRGITIMHIYSSQLKYMRLALPPVAEQSAIAEYLDKATTDVEAATARARRQIQLVQEYRTKLIADVVTGKLDVREAAALLPDEADDEESMDEGGPLADSVAEDLYDPGESVEGLAMESEVTA